MLKLTVLPETAIKAYDAIAESKHEPRKGRLRTLRALVEISYAKYHKAAPDFNGVAPLTVPPQNREDLLHCYDSATQDLDALKARIRIAQPSRQRAFCPYCGINSPNTFEHYLPRTDFPEFAVCHYNLIPACAECNTKKGDSWGSASSREIIHYYYDDLPYQAQWLSASVDVTQNEPVATFKLNLPLVLNRKMRSLISGHYHRLSLLERYQARSVEAFSDALGGNRGSLGQAELAALYRARAEHYGQDFGRNYWKAAVFRAMAQSQTFLAYAAAGASSTAVPSAI